MRQLKTFGLARLIRSLIRRRHFDIALMVVKHFELKALYSDEAKISPDVCPEIWKLIHRHRSSIESLEKAVSLCCVNDSISADTSTAVLQDNALMEALIQKIGKTFLTDRVIARQAAWAALGVSRNQFAKCLMANEKDCLIKMYFSQSIKDYVDMLSCSIGSLNSNYFDICLFTLLPFLSSAQGCDGKHSPVATTSDGNPHPEYYIHLFGNAYSSLIKSNSPDSAVTAMSAMQQPLLYVLKQLGQICMMPSSTHPYVTFAKSQALGVHYVWSSLAATVMTSSQQGIEAPMVETPPHSGPSTDHLGIQNTFIGQLMTSPFTSLTAVVLNPQIGNALTTRKQSQKSRREVQNNLYRHVKHLGAFCKSEARSNTMLQNLASLFAQEAELQRFQMEMSDICNAQTPALASFVGISRASKVTREVLCSIEWNGLTAYQTGQALLVHSNLIPSGEQKLDEFRQKFNINKSVLLLWKIKYMAQRGFWSDFLQCAIEAIRAVPLHTIYKPRAATTSSFASAITSAFTLSPFQAIPDQPLQETPAQFSAYLRLRFGSSLSTESSITSTISSILSAVPGRQANLEFYPLLPDVSGQKSTVQPVCPKLLPPSLCSRLHTLEFVNVAIHHSRHDIALSLVPYISPPSLREKYGIYLGLKDTAQCHRFAQDAIESALARSTSSQQSSVTAGFVLKLISKATTAHSNPLSAWVTTWTPTLPDCDSLQSHSAQTTLAKVDAADCSMFVLQ